MGSPISPTMASLYMEDIETKLLVHHPTPSLWKQYVDDTLAVIKSAYKSSFLGHINSTDQCIQFTGEDSWTDGSMPFLDILSSICMMAVSIQQPTVSPTTLTCICSGSATTQNHLIKVWLVPYTTGTETVCSSPQLLQEEER